MQWLTRVVNADIVFAGGNLQRAMNEVQEAASRIHNGEFGGIRGASVHGFGGEISGGGCQHISVLRLFTNAEVEVGDGVGNTLRSLRRRNR